MKEPKDWKYKSLNTNGFHTVIGPENSICKQTYVFRLNIDNNQSYVLDNPSLELNGVVIEGEIEVNSGNEKYILKKRDSFYLPAGEKLLISTKSKVVVFIGGAKYEGKGDFFTRKFDLNITDINTVQIHGEKPYRRDVFMTVGQYDKASRLICGITSGDEGMWTSWPPHQHTKDMEEVYCYFDIPEPKFALHLSSRINGKVEFVHPVSSGDFVVVPEGYHPTVAMPGVKSSYFWVMAAHNCQKRRYDLSINDPIFD